MFRFAVEELFQLMPIAPCVATDHGGAVVQTKEEKPLQRFFVVGHDLAFDLALPAPMDHMVLVWR